MPRYIDTDLLKCAALAADKDTFTFDEVIALIDAVKPADVQEVKHAKYIKAYNVFPICSYCKEVILPNKYCSNCGAKMDEEEQK